MPMCNEIKSCFCQWLPSAGVGPGSQGWGQVHHPGCWAEQMEGALPRVAAAAAAAAPTHGEGGPERWCWT
jgi:hypothetical protein